MARPTVLYDDIYVQNAIVAEIARIDWAAAIQALVDHRADPEDLSTYPAYPGDTTDFAVWTDRIKAGPPVEQADELPLIKVDLDNPSNLEARKASANIIQTWVAQYRILIMALGHDRTSAERRARDARACIINHWFGGNVFLGLARDPSGVNYTWLDRGDWYSSDRGDQFVCVTELWCRAELRVTNTGV